MRTLSLLSIMCLFGSVVQAQSPDYSREFNPFEVYSGIESFDMPFWGGINSPKVSLLDLDGDGRIDLLFGDPGGRLAYVRNTGTVDQPQWTPISDRLDNIDIGSWHRLVDIDNDGDLDLFCDTRTGLTAWYEQVLPGTVPVFVLADTAYGGFVTGTNNTPDFADIDADGDLDFFFGNVNGTLELYRNVGSAEAAAFEFITNVYDSILAFPGGGVASGALSPEHGFAVIKFIDIDNDNDEDLFWGDIFNPQLYYFANLGDSVVSDLTWVTEDYLPEVLTGFNHPAFGDLDDDGDPDMVLGVSTESDNLRFYRNIGSANVPNLVVEDSSALSIIDVGSNARAAFADLDNDNDPDMLVGGSIGGLTYFKNSGSPTDPKLELVPGALPTITGSNLSPVVCDWDDDGDPDLLIGTNAGRIQYWRNEGSAVEFQPALADDQLGGIKVDQLAVPCPADVDGDGLLDLVVGEWDFNGFANVLLYVNTGSAGAPNLVLQTTHLLPHAARLFTQPAMYDWDGDGRLDLILPDRSDVIIWYRNTAAPGTFPDSLTFVARTDTLPGSLLGSRLTVSFEDIDGDGDDDLFVGEEDGGLNFFRRAGSCCAGPRGNVDADPEDIIDIGDLTQLIDYLYITLKPLSCPLEANIDGDLDEIIDIGDLTWLVAHLYLDGPELPVCPG
jgi:hypothetical protein